MTEVQNLEALEQKAQKALEKMYQGAVGAREFTEAMEAIRNSGHFEDAGYPSFRAYYLARWADSSGRAYSTLTSYLSQLYDVRRFEEAANGLLASHSRRPAMTTTSVLADRIEDPKEQVLAWKHHLESGRPVGEGRSGLMESIREYKGEGVIEQLEDVGVEIPPYPEGPTDEEVAYKKFSDLAAVAKDVTPEAAARAISSSTAYSVAPSYDFMLPWVRGFLAELHLRAGR